MKKLFLLFTLSCCFLSFSGKDTTNLPKYSCNPEIEKAVVKNLADLKEISRERLVMYSVQEQIAIIKTFSKEKRTEMWVEKLLDETVNYKGEQRNFILKLAADFTDGKIKNLSNKAKEARLLFGKDATRIFASMYLPNDSKIPSLFLVPLASTSKAVDQNNPYTCTCSRSSDWCGWAYCCTGGCDWGSSTSNFGCGFMGAYRCDGTCASCPPSGPY